MINKENKAPWVQVDRCMDDLTGITCITETGFIRRVSPIMKYFVFVHSPEKLQKVSQPIDELAKAMENALPDGPEKEAGLRKLLEAKDCFVRAAL